MYAKWIPVIEIKLKETGEWNGLPLGIIQSKGHGPAHNRDNEQDIQNLVYPLGSVLHGENSREFKGF